MHAVFSPHDNFELAVYKSSKYEMLHEVPQKWTLSSNVQTHAWWTFLEMCDQMKNLS
jgi:hypothetical protein